MAAVARFLAPLVAVYVAGGLCPMTPQPGAIVLPAQPPSIVFAIIWPILLLLLGGAWAITPAAPMTDVLFSLLVASLVLWLVMYSCKDEKKGALYVLLLSLLLTTLVVANQAIAPDHKYKTVSTLAVVPLSSWLLFALMLNFAIVNKGV